MSTEGIAGACLLLVLAALVRIFTRPQPSVQDVIEKGRKR